MAEPDVESLLDGLEGSVREERAELIEWLLAQGITVGEIRESVSPMFLASRRLMGDDGSYVSAREISASAGVDLGLLQRVHRAVGLAWVEDPDAAVYMLSDGKIAAHLHRFIEAGIETEHAVQTLRVLADGFSRAAELMRSTVIAAILQPGATELEIAQGIRAMVSRIVPLLGPFVEDMLLLQLRHQLATEAVTASERAAGVPLPGARQVTVAFADLVGFTALGETVPPEELVQLANRLAVVGRDVAVPPVRFVKTIGDAVMLVCPEPVPLLDAVLELIEDTGTDGDFPRLRVGVASGLAVSRVGDWFGSPVNLASRVTGVARPGAVLATESAREAVGETPGFAWSFAGARHLKGISGQVSLFRVRRAPRT